MNITVDEYEMPSGEMKQIMRQLQFIDRVRFMATSLDSLSRNLVEVNGMVCKESRSEADLTHISENYFAHGTCGKCQGAQVTYSKGPEY